MNKFFKLPLYLAIVGAITTFALALAQNITAPVISENEIAAETGAFKDLFPNATFEKSDVTFTDVEKKVGLSAVFEAKENDAVTAYVYKLDTIGYSGGRISTILAISPEGNFVGYVVLVMENQTSGIGTQIADPDFYAQIKDQFFSEAFDMNYISGATYSSRPLVNAIQTATKHYIENFK